MAEQNHDLNKTLNNSSDEEYSDETEERTLLSPNSRRVRDVLQNFFICQKKSAEGCVDENTDDKRQRCAKLLAKLMCRNITQSQFPEDQIRLRNTNSFKNMANGSNERQVGVSNHLDGDGEKTKLLDGYDDDDENLPGEIESDELEDVFLNEDESEAPRIHGDAAATANGRVHVETFQPNSQELQSVNERLQNDFRENRSLHVFSESDCDRIRDTFRSEGNENSGSRFQRSFSCESTANSRNAKSSHKIREFIQRNVRKLRVSRLHSGSVVILNEDDINMKFAAFQPDLEKIVENTETSRAIINTETLSGGRVILEGFADSFKPRDHSTDDPIYLNIPNDMQFPETSEFKLPSTGPRIFARSISGGGIIDDSSRCASLPELFSSKQPDAEMNRCQPAVEHLSGGSVSESDDAQNEIVLNLLRNTLQFHSETDLLNRNNDEYRSDSRTNNSERVFRNSNRFGASSSSVNSSSSDSNTRNSSNIFKANTSSSTSSNDSADASPTLSTNADRVNAQDALSRVNSSSSTAAKSDNARSV